MSIETTLRTTLGSQTADKSVHAQALLKVILNAPSHDERVELLRIAITERDSVPKTPQNLPNKGIPEDVWQALDKTHSEMIDGHLKMAFFKTDSAKNFASEILRLLDFFQTEDEKTFTLSVALYSPYVPYHELPGTPVHMTNVEFKHKLGSGAVRVDLIDYIMKLPFDERTERASMLLQIIDDSEDKGLRVALLAYSLSLLEKQTAERLVKQLRS